MKAFIIAFAAVITAAYAPQTGPFKRILPAPPTVPFEAPVTDAELQAPAPDTAAPATQSEETRKRRGSDRPQRPFFKRFRTRRSETEKRPPSPHRRFSFFLRFQTRHLQPEPQTNPDPPSCQLTP